MGKHQEAFDEFADRVEEELGDSLKKLTLYGSVAKGEEWEESDIDVFAVVKREEQKDKIYDLAAEVGRKHGVHIAVIVRTPREFEITKDSVFSQEVRETGIARV